MTGSRPLSYTLALIATFACSCPVAAQEPDPQVVGNAAAAAPEIHGVLANSQRVLDRLKQILDLTNAEERKQYDTLQEYVEVFLFGVDRKKPVRMDVLSGGDVTSYRLYVPIEKFRTFWKENLVPLGIPVQTFKGTPGVFKLGGGRDDAFDGFMLHDPKEREGYGIIWERPAGEKQAKLPPAGALVPLAPIQGLLQAGYDVAVRLKNKPEGVDVRHTHYAKNREEILGKLKRDADESVSDFNLRKFAAGIQFDETERLYAEAKEFVAGLTVTADPARATGKLRVEPLPGTGLAESVEMIGKQPSRFAGVPRGENAAATGRINFPLDEFRKKNALALSDKIRENVAEELTAAKHATPEEGEASKQFANLFLDLVNAGINSGVADGFVELTKNDAGAHTVVGSMKVPDGKAWVPLVELLPKTGRASDLKANVSEEQGVALHEITLGKEDHPSYFDLFGGGRLLVGTGPDTIWYAAGPGADEALKQAIGQAAQPGQPEMNFLSFRGELLPVVQAIDKRLGQKGQKKYRDLAIQAFQNGEGRLTADLTRSGDAIDGDLSLDVGLLRLLGKGLATFSKENLE